MLFNLYPKSRHLARTALLAAALVAGLMLTARAVCAQDATAQTSQKEVSQLLEQSKAAAAQLEHDAAVLETFTRGNLNWQSHGEQLTRIKEHINTMGGDVKRLQDLRPAAAPWQQEAIDRIIPFMVEMASLTESAIEYVNRNPGKLHTPEYKEYLKDKAELATELSVLISDFVKYDRAKTKMAELEKSLRSAGS
jgi:hypothetical protein